MRTLLAVATALGLLAAAVPMNVQAQTTTAPPAKTVVAPAVTPKKVVTANKMKTKQFAKRNHHKRLAAKARHHHVAKSHAKGHKRHHHARHSVKKLKRAA